MSTGSRIFVIAAFVSAAAWFTKAAVIAANGGSETGGGVIGVLWAIGALGLFTASAAAAAEALRSRPGWLRVVGAVLAVAAAFVVLNVVDLIVKSVYPGEGWFRDELSLLLIGLVLIGIAARVLTRGVEPRTAPAA